MINIKYIDGDVTAPQGDGKRLIIHCCNDIGKMGAGVALAIMKKWPVVRSEYIKWYKKNNNFKLGEIQTVRVENDIAVINMIGQKDIREINKIPPIRYEAMEKCLEKVADIAIKYKALVNAPYLMGCGLAGGDWDKMENILIKTLCSKDIPLILYDLYSERKS